MTTIKTQGLYDAADPDFDPYGGDQYDQTLFEEKHSFVYSILVTSFQTDKGREPVKEFEGDARTIISKLHHYHTQSNDAQHEVVTLTTYITNLNLTDRWKHTTRHFLSHFKEKLRLLDSLATDADKIQETVRITFLLKAVDKIMTSGRFMSLILSGDPRQDLQENLLLKSIMTCFGMQHTSMTSTTLHRGRLSSHTKLIILMNLTMNLEKIT